MKYFVPVITAITVSAVLNSLIFIDKMNRAKNYLHSLRKIIEDKNDKISITNKELPGEVVPKPPPGVARVVLMIKQQVPRAGTGDARSGVVARQ